MLNLKRRMMRVGTLALLAMAAFPAMASAAQCDKVRQVRDELRISAEQRR